MEERQTIDQRLETEKIGGSHIRIVEPGDTLHGIAFANGLDVNALAAWNRLTDTSKLQVGQRVRLTRPINFSARSPAGDSAQSTQTKAVVKPATVSTAKRSVASTTGKQKSAGKPKSTAVRGTRPQWQWPASGQVIAGFSKNGGRQGIDIQGEAGQAVFAAGDGEVVYVGNGLKGYGNLVIIKHDDVYLSAYAHNQETFVQEGQKVAARFRIASIGRNKQQREALHFQIRKNGQPVNPLSYLPSR